MQRKTLIVLIFLFFTSALNLSAQGKSTDGGLDCIFDLISNSFNRILEESYNTGNNGDNYFTFLSKYLASKSSSTDSEKRTVNLKLNREQILKINNILDSINRENGFCIFPQIIYCSSSEELKRMRGNGRTAGAVLIYSESKAYSSASDFYKKLNARPSIMVDTGSSCFLELLEPSSEITALILDQIKYTGEISLMSIASYYLQSDKKVQLSNLETERLLSVIYWKVICFESGVNFYK